MQTSNAVLVHGTGLSVVAVGDYLGDRDVTCVHVLLDKVNVAHAGALVPVAQLVRRRRGRFIKFKASRVAENRHICMNVGDTSFAVDHLDEEVSSNKSKDGSFRVLFPGLQLLRGR